jgi:ketosteroid isomerase-like protein
MRTQVADLAVLAVGCMAWACSAPPQETAALSDEDVAVIKAMCEEDIVDALLAKDWTTFAAAFTEDAVRMVPNEPTHVGRAAIEEWAAANWGAMTFSDGSQALLEVDGRGDIAYAQLSYSFAVEVPGLQEPIVDVGKGLVILRKQADGSWLVSHSIYNADHPPPAGAPEGT